ncbi:multidrug efflux system protein [Legionella busanensis]|uniref:Multidrug efflux system protein n=1 Tax=Legionella busanensis TaxID=190655 RepID=A0A378KHX2_9GAMM|nr:MFS transporter [Legionella busanensis]STX81374.1 multidrug efflux system protein [Legionella busanensis]
MNAQAIENNQQKIGLLIFAIAIGIFTLAFNATTFYNLTPLLIKEFNLSTTTAQWLFNSYLLAILALVVIGGKLGDNFGRRTIFLIGSLVFALGSFVIAIGINGWMFILGRTIQGLGVAFIFPGSSSLIRDSVPEDKQIFVFGIWSAASGLGMALGPIIGGIIAELLNWRIVFIVNIGVMVFSCIIILLCASNNKNMSVNQTDFVGLILFIISITTIVLALVEGNTWGWINIKTLSSFMVGIISLAIFLYVETKICYPLLNLKSFTNPFFSIGISQTLFPKIAIAALPREKTGEASGMVVKSIYVGVI